MTERKATWLRWVAVLGVVFALCKTSQAQERVRIVEVVSRDAENKGKVKLGEVVGRRVVIRNVSDRSMSVEVSSKSCGCLDARAEPETVGPGQESVLTFSVPVAGSPDPQHYQVVFRGAIKSEGKPRFTQDIITDLRYIADFAFVLVPRRLIVGELPVALYRPADPAAK